MNLYEDTLKTFEGARYSDVTRFVPQLGGDTYFIDGAAYSLKT